ncbi:MAG: Clp protease N-terminal domain-containing protein [Gemmataceae bacterium]
MMAQPEDDIFIPCGRIRPELLGDGVACALRESLSSTRATNWDSVRTPHLFMGLLAAPDAGVLAWAERIGADLPKLLDQFRELFYQDSDPLPPLRLNREFLSDNVIRLLRDAHERAKDYGRSYLTQFDILITLFATPNNIVAECFERIGLTASRLTEVAVLAEREDGV